jgi:hypothetical protein
MPLQTLIRTAVPFMAGGAFAIFLAELTRPQGVPRDESFPQTWFTDAERAPEHLWPGEPTFNWGD